MTAPESPDPHELPTEAELRARVDAARYHLREMQYQFDVACDELRNFVEGQKAPATQKETP